MKILVFFSLCFCKTTIHETLLDGIINNDEGFPGDVMCMQARVKSGSSRFDQLAKMEMAETMGGIM